MGMRFPKAESLLTMYQGLTCCSLVLEQAKELKNQLIDSTHNYTDKNDWKMRKELENEASDYNLWKGIWDNVTTDTDDEILDKRIGKAKRRIGK